MGYAVILINESSTNSPRVGHYLNMNTFIRQRMAADRYMQLVIQKKNRHRTEIYIVTPH